MSHAPLTVFVTGATGLLGGHVVRQLLHDGHRVRALVRDVERAQDLLPFHPGLVMVQGDLQDVPAFAAHLAGADAVIHAGAYFRESFQGGRHLARLLAINVEGTRALVAAALEHAVGRFLQVSSIGTLRPWREDRLPVREDDRLAADETENDYYRSKILADEVVEDALRTNPELWGAFVLPGFMNGPGDAGPTAAGRTILDFMARRLPGVVNAHFSFVDARDVATACVRALTEGQRGRRYIVAGRRMHLADQFELLGRITGVPGPRRRVPMGLLGVVALLQEVWARLTGRPVLMGLAIYRTLRREGPHGAFDSTRAQRELGVAFRPLEETFRDAVVWLQAR
ncbi:MAG: NAD(P)H-binding protein [Myxococcales bacterium]|nr:NAD(P)H-binding protein [Myxococcales bacterium]MCB9652052.1 NAD(P)H-binding protein [Deltaproteobacteria bacterium]